MTDCEVNTGGRYDPSADTWLALPSDGAPSPRHDHTGVWTGDRLLVWGGGGELLNTGATFNPATNTWTAITTDNAPEGRRLYGRGVWTGAELIVWGGITATENGSNTGGVYCPLR